MRSVVVLTGLATFLFASVVLAQMAPVEQSPDFRIDDAGNVYYVNGWGRIAKNGSQTNWHPDDDSGEFFLVTPGGDVVFENSYGKLCRNGANLYYDWIRKHYFKLDGKGNIYTVSTWVDEEIQRNGHDLGYEIGDGRDFQVDRAGRVYYVDKRERTLFINGRDTGQKFFHPRLIPGKGTLLYFVVNQSSGPRRLMSFNYKTGKQTFIGLLAHLYSYCVDKDKTLWYANSGRRIIRGGSDTGFKGYLLAVDGEGNCFSHYDKKIFRNGEDMGWGSHGTFAVTPDGTCFHFHKKGSKRLYRNGQALSFEVK